MANVKSGGSEWVVVCDGAKALLLENTGTMVQPKLVTKEVHEQDNPKNHEIASDRPGRAFHSVGAKRSAMEETDLHDRNEQQFLTQLAGRLDQAALGGDLRSLVLVAPPRALGVLRAQLSANVKQSIRVEIDKDLVKMPLPEIEKHIVQ